MRRRIIFRADGDDKIGTGHVIRSLALAKMLMSDFQCCFLIQEPPEPVIYEIKTSGLELIVLAKSTNYLEESQYIINNICSSDDIIVLDGYNFDTKYQRVIKDKGCKLVCVDDKHKHHFLADIVINHSEGIRPSDYSKENYTKLYLGFDFALLRPPFLKLAKGGVGKVKKTNEVLTCIGGADPLNLTEKILKIFKSIDLIEKIFVITGGSYKFQNTLESQGDAKTEFLKHLTADQMAFYMGKVSLGVFPSSGISLEAVASRLPFVTGYFIDNQKKTYRAMVTNQLAIGLGDFTLLSYEEGRTKIMDALKSVKRLSNIITNQMRFLDGNSNLRLVDIFKAL